METCTEQRLAVEIKKYPQTLANPNWYKLIVSDKC